MATRKPRRPRWDDRPEYRTRCQICSWLEPEHSNVCPLGPMPTGRRTGR